MVKQGLAGAYLRSQGETPPHTPQMKKVTTIKQANDVLQAHGGYCIKEDGNYFAICHDQFISEMFDNKADLLSWATFTFWNRDLWG